MSVLVPVPHCLDYYGFVILPAVWETWFLFLRIALAILGFLRLHINFWVVCSCSVKNVMGNLIETALNL